MTYEIGVSQRKVILLKQRVDEILKLGCPIRASTAKPNVFLVVDNTGVMTIVDDTSKPTVQSNQNPLNGIKTTRSQLNDWASGVVGVSVIGKRSLDQFVLALWPEPEEVKDEDKQQIDNKAVKKLQKNWSNDKRPGPISNNDIGRMEFATSIGLTCARARYTLDRAYQNKPSFHVFAMTSQRANSFCEDHGGAYFLYRAEDSSWTREHGYLGGVLLKSVLVMRYPVPYKTFNQDTQDSYCRIHCKYIIPQISKNKPKNVYKYDGYCAPGHKNNDSWQWLFQQRQSTIKEHYSDILVMYTGKFLPSADYNGDKLQSVIGDSLTEYQGVRKGEHKAYINGRVIMIKVPGYVTRQVNEDGSKEKLNDPHIALHKELPDGSFVVENEHVFTRKHARIIDLSKPNLKLDQYDRLATRRLLVTT